VAIPPPPKIQRSQYSLGAYVDILGWEVNLVVLEKTVD
jgi:hypothetical protein